MTTAINAKVLGQGKDPPVLLVHELGGSLASFRWMAGSLKDRHAVAIDLPGSGASPVLADCAELGDYADAVGRFVDEALGRPVILVGMAFGAAVGTILAVRRPDLAAGLLYCCMGPVIEPHTRAFLEARCERVLAEGVLPTVDASLEYSFPAQVRAGREGVFAEYRNDLASTRVEGYVSQSLALARSGTTIGDHLRKIRAPVTVVAGEYDKHFGLDVLKSIGALLPNLRELSIIEDAAHFPHIQSPERLAGLIRSFADSDTRRTT